MAPDTISERCLDRFFPDDARKMSINPCNGKVLVIDDDEAMRYSLKRVLSSRGFLVETADSGRRGLDLAETEEFEVIFLDNRMDGMDGLETLKHLKAVSPHAMVIFMHR